MIKFKGFTLIELLVVISIMSILTIITVSQFETAKRKARDVQRKGDLSSLARAIGMYFADYGKYPSVDDPDNPIDINSLWGGEFTDQGYVYMKTMPRENYLSDFPYCYVVSADQGSFGLFAKLENEQDADCVGNSYSQCGNDDYCYSIVSPNTRPEDL